MAKEKQKKEIEQEEFGMEFSPEELEVPEEKEKKQEQNENKEKQ